MADGSKELFNSDEESSRCTGEGTAQQTACTQWPWASHLEHGQDDKCYDVYLTTIKILKNKIEKLVSSKVKWWFHWDWQANNTVAHLHLPLHTLRPRLHLLRFSFLPRSHTKRVLQLLNEQLVLQLHQFKAAKELNPSKRLCLLFKTKIILTYLTHKVVMRAKVRSRS